MTSVMNILFFCDILVSRDEGNMKNLKVPLKNPKPDFKTFREVLEGRKKAERVYFVELLMDEEIKKYITENLFGERWISYSPERREDYWKQDINFWYKMSYDYIRVSGGLNFPGKSRETKDTAFLSQEKRGWAEEGKGPISSWQDFEKYPWPKAEEIDYSSYEFTSKNLPEGMKMLVCPSSGVFEVASGSLLGLENMSYLLADIPDLVEAVFKKAGESIHIFCQNVIGLNNVGGIFQGDDMGFTTSTTISPALLRKLVLPWHKKFAALAHQKNKMYWLHCCGNVLPLMEDFINEVKIDAFHSFQDTIISVGEFKKRYQEIAVLGGVDIDKLCRLEENDLRKYVRGILENCMPGRYALGSGNSIANYVPVKNYLTMLDEGMNWAQTCCP